MAWLAAEAINLPAGKNIGRPITNGVPPIL
jgi:hypothetical protein